MSKTTPRLQVFKKNSKDISKPIDRQSQRPPIPVDKFMLNFPEVARLIIFYEFKVMFLHIRLSVSLLRNQ